MLAPARGRHRARPLVTVALGLALLLGGLHAAHAQAVPRYALTVRLDLEAHTITGVLELTLDPDDPRLGEALWFHLPPNRFVSEDPRGRRRPLDSLPFATNFTNDGVFDPIWPAGFSSGSIDIEAVETDAGVALPIHIEPNPAIPQGYSVRAGLMRVELGDAAGARRFRIRFVTHLPRRYWEGWSDAGVLVQQWYPMLANRGGGGWSFDVFAPRPGRYAAEVTVNGSGQLFLGHGRELDVRPGEPVRMPEDEEPLRAFPLIFRPEQPMTVAHAYDVSLYSYYEPGHARLGRLAVRFAGQFLNYVREKYRLPPPSTRITMVEVPLPPGDIRTVGSLVLIPTVYYQNSGVLDRVFLAQLSRAVAQVWFGETVWSNRDRESWLHLGLSGYLALDFFNSLYGWNAGIHDIMDWLQPKYREHFFEAPLRDLIRADRDAPLMISLQNYPLHRPAMLVAHNKAPLVLRSLYYVVGRDAFARGLNALYYRYRYREVTLETLRDVLSETSGRDLTPFFRAWFDGTPHINFAVERWEQERTPTGYAIHAHVRRTPLPLTPVDVQVTTETGRVFTQRWESGPERAVLNFSLPERAASITVDPEEYWLELDRKDNHSEILYRVRPIFDWPKQREVLVTLHGTAGGNSIDGNYVGLGVNVTLNENNHFTLIPIYGERTGLNNYRARWLRQQFLLPNLSLNLTLEELGGTTQQALGFRYDVIDTDTVRLTPALDFRAETVAEAGFVDLDGTVLRQTRGRVNNVGVSLEFRRKPGVHYGNLITLEVVDSQPAYRSDFDFTTGRMDVIQTLALGSSHYFTLQLTRAGVEGTPPLQKRHELGGPELLRGYPRVLELANEEIAAARLDYGLVVSRGIYGTAAQLRRITLLMFGDVGRGWNNGEQFDSRPQRQDLGLGVELRLNLLRLVEFPLRLDLAYPVNDDRFKGPQFILFGLLNF